MIEFLTSASLENDADLKKAKGKISASFFSMIYFYSYTF